MHSPANDREEGQAALDAAPSGATPRYNASFAQGNANTTIHPRARTTARAVRNEKGLVERLGVDSSGVLLPWVGGVVVVEI